jgi:hypothetical protein
VLRKCNSSCSIRDTCGVTVQQHERLLIWKSCWTRLSPIFRFTASDYLFGILKLIFPPSSRAIIPQSDELLPDKTIIPQSNELPPDKTIISQV